MNTAVNAEPATVANPWPERLNSWHKFSEKFHERGEKIERRYEDERDDAGVVVPGMRRVNMFYSNTTVIKESLYNSLPKPSVNRLHESEFDNEPARVAATIMERGLSYEIHCAPDFDAAIKCSILDRLVPGLGNTWITFHAAEGGKPEHLSVDIVYWRDFIYEPQRTWEAVTWAGRALHIASDVAKARWGDGALVAKKAGNQMVGQVDNAIELGKVCIYQIWDKTTRKVVHLNACGDVLETVEDPYKLADFFPCPKPLIASPPTRKFLPLADYYMAQDQYSGMDVTYARIHLIIEAVKVAGVYDATIPELNRMLGGAENKLIPVDNWAMLADKGGVKGVIDWYPVEVVTQVLTTLTSTYEFQKAQLFEVTGMADIIRGSSNQYETAAAQTMKAQFASVRMNGFQRDVSTFVRDVLRITGEVMTQLYSDEKLSAIVGKLPEADQQFVPQALAILRNDFKSQYSIDIEADSLTQADWALQQGQRMAYVQALTGFLQSAIPAAQAAPALAPLLMQIIKFASVGFKGSSELEGVLDQAMTDLAAEHKMNEEKKAGEPTPQEKEMQMEFKMEQMKIQAKQESDMKKAQADLLLDQQRLAMEQEAQRQQMVIDQQKHEAEMQFLREQNAEKLAFLRERNAIELAQNQQRFEHERIQDQQRLANAEARKDEAAEAALEGDDE